MNKIVDSFFIKGNIDIYITGSNSYVFSGQHATNLRGRYIEISMLPLSFKEYCELSEETSAKAFRKYMNDEGFPYLTQHDLKKKVDQLMIEIKKEFNVL